MAQIVVGIGTSHTPLLALPPELWEPYAANDRRQTDLVYPPDAKVLSFEEGARCLPAEIRDKPRDLATFQRQSAACQRAIATLVDTLASAKPDITIIISDDQDEWFYDSNMPRFAIYWGETIPLIPRKVPAGAPELARLAAEGYGDVRLDVPVASAFGRFVLDYLLEHDFDVAHMTYAERQYGGTVARRYPSPDGEVCTVRESAVREQGLPHGFAFVIKRLFQNRPGPILPIFQNTCYPPNTPTPRRSYQLGRAIAGAIAAWPEDARVAVIASGGLSHFVVDEEIDRLVLDALQRKDAAALQALPRHRLLSATSESLNWVALSAAVEDTPLRMELLDYVPVYRSEAATGGGWAFARWQ
jgi:3-O-methylgallate 3,4-dioxygenase